MRSSQIRVFCAALALAACAKTVPAPAGLGEPCVANGDCANGFLCAAGKCVLPANLGGCEASRLRCNGADVEKCDVNGLGWSTVTTCPTGCTAGACKEQLCSPGATRCEGDAAEQCTPAGAAWALVQICPSHCDSTTGHCRAPVCTPFSTRCDPAGDATQVEICDSFGAGWQTQSCGASKTCDSGRCQDVICAAGQTRCSGDGGSVEVCNASRDGYTSSQSCGIRCGVGTGVAACVPVVCSAGVTTCAASALEQCLPDGSGFSFVTFCASGCESPTSTSADCKTPVCAPLQRVCAADGGSVKTCLADGSGFAVTDTCSQGCVAGNCTTSSAGCNAGDLRCNGADAQSCAQTAPGITAWQTSATCVAGCSSGACLPGGSCVALTLNTAAPSGAAGPPAAPPAAPQDGVSTVLFFSDPILGADGSLLPDGLEFTVAISSSTGPLQIASNDADAAQPGVQVRSLAGRVHFRVRAPASTGSDLLATATATLVGGPSCKGAAQLTFAVAPTDKVLVAEDFTTATNRDLTTTTADWDTARGAAVAAFPVQTGAGEDGALSVGAGTTFDLSTSGYAPAFSVIGLNGRTVNVDAAASGLSGGDEVILWNVQGSGSGFSNAGTYELHHVAQVSGTQVILAENVIATFGTQNDENVATQKVVLQRVPHFSALTVLNTATITTSGWDGNKGGLIFLRVSGQALVQGEIKLDGAGYRGGRTRTTGEDGSSVSGGQQGAGGLQSGGGYASAGLGPYAGQPFGLPLLGRLFFGAGGGGGNGGGGGSGGGAIVIAAQTLSLAGANNAQQGRIHADGSAGVNDGGSGAGGSVWVAATKVTLGSGPAGTLSAQGGNASYGAGRVRLDYLSTDGVGTGCSRSTPACASAISGPLTVQSLDAYDLTAAQRNQGLGIRSAELLVTLGTLLVDAGANPLVSYQASTTANDTPDFTTSMALSAPGVIVFPSGDQGARFRWRAQLSPPPGPPQELLGLQWQLKVQ